MLSLAYVSSYTSFDKTPSRFFGGCPNFVSLVTYLSNCNVLAKTSSYFFFGVAAQHFVSPLTYLSTTLPLAKRLVEFFRAAQYSMSLATCLSSCIALATTPSYFFGGEPTQHFVSPLTCMSNWTTLSKPPCKLFWATQHSVLLLGYMFS